ncbi:EF-hand domain-containing protein [Streptomyces minutiscleroticus]|uniref:Calcium-binding protein n=1 Tax=Streptomyces minutiscleroticus TaxID=68238 RepID=A0A918NU02_9ACTN|nr:EF-hand domain-containing protein [Streptomyces minutiscleroticus]GGX96469.1 calcium-binding protein [Streptomyces minutiscleroticus]
MTTEIANDRLRKRFQKWDTDGSGSLERGDFVGEAKKIAQNFGAAPGSPEVQSLNDAFQGLFDYLSSGSESVSEDQFLNVTGNLIFQQGEADFNRALGPVIEALVGLCDKNDDGLINGGEFAAWLTAVGVGPDRAEEVFQQVDTDGDGELSQQELLAAVRNYHFGRLDVELLG